MQSRRSALCFLTKICGCILVWLGVLFFYLFGWPNLRAFDCKDSSISFPLRGDTVTGVALFLIGFGVPIFLILVLEILQFRWPTPRLLQPQSKVEFILRVLLIIAVFVIGAGVTMFITDVGKYTVGRPRPHFLTVCQPLCNSTVAADTNFVIGRDPKVDPCTYGGISFGSSYQKKDIRLSFPSGHSSFSFYTLLFAAVYVEFAMAWAWSAVPRLVIQAGLLCLAFFITISRVLDYKHHPTDVLSGAIIGIIVAFFTVFSQTNWYLEIKRRRRHLTFEGEVETDAEGAPNAQWSLASGTQLASLPSMTPPNVGLSNPCAPVSTGDQLLADASPLLKRS